MDKNLFFWIVVCVLSVNYSCESKKSVLSHGEIDSAYSISIGTECGWCTPADSTRLSGTSYYRLVTISCELDESKRRVVSQGTISESDWNELVSLLDYQAFSQMDLNTCNLCVDGCDDWIQVITQSDTHLIRFGYQDSIAPIAEFVNKLEEIVSTIRSVD